MEDVDVSMEGQRKAQVRRDFIREPYKHGVYKTRDTVLQIVSIPRRGYVEGRT